MKGYTRMKTVGGTFIMIDGRVIAFVGSGRKD